MDPIFDFMANPMVRYFLTMVGGYLLKRWPAFFNQAIPAATLAINVLLSVLGAVFGSGVAYSQSSGVPGAILDSPVWEILIPWLLGTGTHSVVKNGILQWLRAGFRIFLKPGEQKTEKALHKKVDAALEAKKD